MINGGSHALPRRLKGAAISTNHARFAHSERSFESACDMIMGYVLRHFGPIFLWHAPRENATKGSFR
jgi:hypothetical protein